MSERGFLLISDISGYTAFLTRLCSQPQGGSATSRALVRLMMNTLLSARIKGAFEQEHENLLKLVSATDIQTGQVDHSPA